MSEKSPLRGRLIEDQKERKDEPRLTGSLIESKRDEKLGLEGKIVIQRDAAAGSKEWTIKTVNTEINKVTLVADRGGTMTLNLEDFTEKLKTPGSAWSLKE